jgi:hypothetical protein
MDRYGHNLPISRYRLKLSSCGCANCGEMCKSDEVEIAFGNAEYHNHLGNLPELATSPLHIVAFVLFRRVDRFLSWFIAVPIIFIVRH